MTHRLSVLVALEALICAALPGVAQLGLGNGESAPPRVPAGGRAVLRSGDPGDAEVDLSPPAYHWSHRIPLELIGASEAQVDGWCAAIGAAIEADRTLGGLCTWIEAEPPLTEDVTAEGARALRGASLILVADYTTTSPLG